MKTQVVVSLCVLFCLLMLLGCGQSDTVKREKFSGQEEVAMYQAAINILGFLPDDFDYESMVLFRNAENSIVGLAHKGNDGFMVGNSVNVNLRTVCTFYEPVIINEYIQFADRVCSALGKLDGPTLTLESLDECGFCGMGATINGEFTRFAEIVFEYSGGKASVKQVYKLN